MAGVEGRGRAQPGHHRVPASTRQRAECERLLTDVAFEDCQGLVPLELYVQACVQDRCQCPQGTSCVCSTIAEFSRQCSHAGGRPGNWRTAKLCRKRWGGETRTHGAPRGTSRWKCGGLCGHRAGHREPRLCPL